MGNAQPRETAQFLVDFFDELIAWGIRDVVISPGSRSTPLAMTVYEMSRQCPGSVRVFVDIDERGAGFFALGIAKASNRPAALICTSGTAVANYYPAVLEAEASRVPLLVLTGDRPLELQGLGSPQTCDQVKAYGEHVRAFRQMPLPSGDVSLRAFARQAAREACLAAGGSGEANAGEQRLSGACLGGPVQINFPFEEPLKPDFSSIDWGSLPMDQEEKTVCPPTTGLLCPEYVGELLNLLSGKKTLVVAGDGSCATVSQAREILTWANMLSIPVLADPLSGLRVFEDDLVIDNYDCVLGSSQDLTKTLVPEVIIRFGRYPVSKRTVNFLADSHAIQIVVDACETRDFICTTSTFLKLKPSDFARSCLSAPALLQGVRTDFAQLWIAFNNQARERMVSVSVQAEAFEGSFVRCVVEHAPEGSCLFVSNSMSVRALDSFYVKENKALSVLCNRGLNGIEGSLSTAFGAAQEFCQTTMITGDLAFLHDINALALQRELRVQQEILREQGINRPAPSVVVVLLNNNGGGIFDMLPQKSEEAYFERLFLTPQDVDFSGVVKAFGVPYACVETVQEFTQCYQDFLGIGGISVIEVPVALGGLKDRYAPFWSLD